MAASYRPRENWDHGAGQRIRHQTRVLEQSRGGRKGCVSWAEEGRAQQNAKHEMDRALPSRLPSPEGPTESQWINKTDGRTDEGPGENPTLSRKQQFGQCLENGEQASSAAEAPARLSTTSNCPESGLGWGLAVLPHHPMLGSRAGAQPWCYGGSWQVMQRRWGP